MAVMNDTFIALTSIFTKKKYQVYRSDTKQYLNLCIVQLLSKQQEVNA